jgi:asparagine synthase (glutamine-hydrolysing)
MCGVAGFWARSQATADPVEALRRMTDAIRHRGPDDDGQWFDTAAGIALGHRRLSILDLSPEGHQPMTSPSGRYVMVFNGEFYNWQALRREEEAHGAQWRGHSDTEVFLAVVERRGVVAAVEAVSGMFAFALWDREVGTLWLGRDRLGEKPLYYGHAGQTLLFGSELGALRAHPAWHGALDREAAALFFRFNYVPAPRSIYAGIRKVRPGTLLRLNDGGRQVEEVVYWSARSVAERAAVAPLREGDDALVERLDALLREVVGRQMVADVPLGAFLSGGIDSSLVVGLMQVQSARPVRTFSIGFEEERWNEAEFAKAVARHLGTDHTELYVTDEEMIAVVPRLPQIYDEPFADSSQIPTFLVAELARRHVTVSLSGDGGDEVFGGYTRYQAAGALWRRLSAIPGPLRRAVAAAAGAASPEQWDRLLRAVLPARLWSRRGITGRRIQRYADVLGSRSAALLYRGFVSHWTDPAASVLGVEDPVPGTDDAVPWEGFGGVERSMMLQDTVRYLPDDILVKVDRATMAVSLESRAPFLDHEVFEFAWRLEGRHRLHRGVGKPILRRLLERYLPPALFERPKMGFGVPLATWLRGPLREWAAALLDRARLQSTGLLDPQVITARWREHLDGTRNWQYPLWNVLMLEAWREARGGN